MRVIQPIIRHFDFSDRYHSFILRSINHPGIQSINKDIIHLFFEQSIRRSIDQYRYH